ncbi:MAG: ATP-binding protein, partial [Dehalococcoidia bacterium]
MADSASATVLVGRDDECSALAAALDATRAGRGGAVLLSGEAGIGKTQLAGYGAALAAQRRMRTVWGRCSRDPEAPAYWPWVQALRAALRSVESDTIADALGPHLEMLVHLLPELREQLTPPSTEHGSDPGQARFRLFESVTALMLSIASTPHEGGGQEAAAETGLAVVLDDIDQADDASLALLVFVAQAIVDAPVLIIGTFRQETLAERSSVRDTLAELARVRGTRRLLLPPLDIGAVQTLLTHMLGTPVSPALAAAVQNRTGGVPFYVTELARALQGRPLDVALTMVPPSVREIVHTRAARMTPATVAAVTTASVLGQEFDISVLASMTDQALDPVLDAIAEAERAHLVAATERPGAYRFAHAMVRDTLYEALPTAQRVRLHRLAGEALERRYG